MQHARQQQDAEPGSAEIDPQVLLRGSPRFRRTVVLMVLIAVLLFNWEPDTRLLATPARKREQAPPLPEVDSEIASTAARRDRSAAPSTRGPRRAARQRTSRHRS